ncbi:chromosome segregation protein SMC [Oscillatoria salina]|uniref:chromosome segregation protein SMC n=1 Tax=Oscillatoria salina TaxID=331517 RepID=UPI001CCEE8EB|nr:chromosome segregation protein SMC [Oscillatoria salina]MBZ8183282.1 chromosome segregation protein SMC [Oscillatoria salina IIICB1]
MVHIKRVELTNFKSFGGTTSIPLLDGFTVVSGPNGSGKSNILDALLFALGLASSKGMRAERLPDLVNHNQSNRKGTVETSVTVTFDLSDGSVTLPPSVEGNGHLSAEESEVIPNSEWSVTRRLRVTKGGNYASTYYLNGESCTATELHEQLNRLRIYPEGYNIVLQGDVTRIITMNSRERREIIDELAGVAEFDRKITQTRLTLDTVREREERCRIIEQELTKARDRLAADKVKAQKYKQLKAEIQEKQRWEVVLKWRSLQQQQTKLQAEIAQGEQESTLLTQQLTNLATQITQTTAKLEQLNTQVKALGEEEQIAVASELAQQQAQQSQLQQRQQELSHTAAQTQAEIAQTQAKISSDRENLAAIQQQKTNLETNEITTLSQQRQQAQATLDELRQQADKLASASEAWVQEQTSLTRNIDSLQETLDPKRREQAQLNERYSQLEAKIKQQTALLAETKQELALKQLDAIDLEESVNASQAKTQNLTQQLAAAEQERTIHQETQSRLLKEQREKQRQLDKLEATSQAQQEAQGTYATKIILQSDLPGVCGLVAQLGQTAPQYQLALEIAAGGRLGHIVVEDDSIAAAGIALLKEKRAGRATFLPLNKIQPPRSFSTVALSYARGFVNSAVNLIECEQRYRNVFAYVFGSTVVFENLETARAHLGQYRIVTLDGELLEASGAMTGGSRPTHNTLHFGTQTTGESAEIQQLKRRLREIEELLGRYEQISQEKNEFVKGLSQELTESRQFAREQQLHLQQLQREIERLTNQKNQLETQLSQNSQELETATQRLHSLAEEIPNLETQLQQSRQKLAELEASGTHSEWQESQKQIKTAEQKLQQISQNLRAAEVQLQDLANQCSRLEEKIALGEQHLLELGTRQISLSSQEAEIKQHLEANQEKINQTEQLLAKLTAKLGETKKERDRVEKQLTSQQTTQRQRSWLQEKLLATQQERQAALLSLQTELETQQAELPDPLPEIPLLVNTEPEANAAREIAFDSFSAQLEQLQKELHNLQKRLEAMEPVNMLALEEYDRTQARLQELSAKLSTIAAERTELLLRIENFTTLRFRAFKEAFDAVNENFQTIFATLSEGDGYLQLDDPEDPFAGGLNLVAHPKGKPVQRLSSMSGGEKSLTALSFIFSLQRYRPSPFYAFDEVDMFLDGANVERLARMIKKQAQQAQFIVVSLRRPTIESAERTIGVTQARGAYTQVLGIKL